MRAHAVLASGTLALALLAAPASAADRPDLIFKESTRWRALTPDDKLATYAVDDPAVDGVACYYTVPEKGGVAGAFGLAEEVSDISLACRQVGPIKIKEKLAQGDVMFSRNDPSSSSTCRSCAAATPSETRWSIWSIRTS